ncbi:hypothetical protein DVS28_b0323 (plasmid) [Euzebya pacifica]|uniref:Endonuclease/exonuclease/phosphatase domain-containing protein n=1 Tax=Euzebya pacifica TaxID=1608957 RepID=A0A346Y6J6_9ACTN|nr:endonuclease/exonuclease/phosphatase family protein [Euzebya pacifica]AXV10093.1 hypothetical protein DVS28_b0323 [Euzebya pacifica]
MPSRPAQQTRPSRILTWNLQWAAPRSWRTAVIADRIRSEAADVAVLTEARIDVARSLFDHVAHPGPHPASRQPNGSKVVIASNHPMRVVDLLGSPHLPERNFAAVDVDLPDRTLRVIGVVVRWREKRRYIDALPDALAATVNGPTVLAGDFNLPMTRSRGLDRDLRQTLSSHDLHVWTASDWPQLASESALIDHVAGTPDLTPTAVRVWPRRCAPNDPRPVTDHAGAVVELPTQPTSTTPSAASPGQPIRS